jgi:imidazole glycerol-phosphate synthase subunit HisH
MICIIDYGSGNLNSIKNAVIRLQQDCIISNDFDQINKSTKIILPGVGAFAPAMEKLKKLNLDKVLNNEVLVKNKPILGICLGFQIMFSESYEFKKTKGLNWVKGLVTKIDTNFRIPHNGWNKIKVKKKNQLISKDLENYFYFNHSLSIKNTDKDFEVLGTTSYGKEFVSIGKKNNNIFGIQPHPEKSQLDGLELIKNFLRL